ncbi:hypothetical protein [Leifsonia sp. RAF41]|uniref:hypothetical protein n=1 Tax=Leifsonia sp. RAF41 TaxID=3233056 RepID=UPI003F9A4DD8
MSLRDVFGFDVRRAINATRPRRIASFGSMLVLVALAIAFRAVAPWWVWPALLVLEGVVFLILGNRWAAKDALRREQD